MRLAIFDMDGTVIDTIADIHTALSETLSQYRFPPVDIEMTKQYVGSGLRQTIINAVGQENFKDEMEKWLRAYYKKNMMNTTHLMDGFQPVLDYIKESGIRCVILSNKNRQIVDDMVKHFGLEDYFCAWYGGDTFGVKKPSPVPVQAIMSAAESEPSETIMIGDSSSDVTAGADAGAKTCFCAYGYGTLKGAEPDFTADSPSRLIKILEEF